jgi:predicted CopG family antitoxin
MRKRKLTRQIGVMISEETYQTLISITDQLEISISELIRKMIEEKVNHSNVDKKYPKGGNLKW